MLKHTKQEAMGNQRPAERTRTRDREWNRIRWGGRIWQNNIEKQQLETGEWGPQVEITICFCAIFQLRWNYIFTKFLISHCFGTFCLRVFLLLFRFFRILLLLPYFSSSHWFSVRFFRPRRRFSFICKKVVDARNRAKKRWNLFSFGNWRAFEECEWALCEFELFFFLFCFCFVCCSRSLSFIHIVCVCLGFLLFIYLSGSYEWLIAFSIGRYVS